MPGFLPYGRQTIDEDDIAALVEAARSDFLTTGPRVEAFEQALADATRAPFAVVCNSGTAALHLACLSLGLKPGDQVIVPTVTFLATANAPTFTGAEVVFADVDPDTGLLTAETLEEALSRAPRAKACFPVHLNGHCCDMEAIGAVAARAGISVVEDACHALGAQFINSNGSTRAIGDCSYSDVAVFSFHPVKAITTGEGGGVTTAAPELADRLRRFRNHGMSRDPATFSLENNDLAFDEEGSANPWYYEMQEPGLNYRLPDLLCALGQSQLGKLADFVGRRRRLARHYDGLFEELAPYVQPVKPSPTVRSAYHLYAVLIDFEAMAIPRPRLMRRLAERDIGSQVHYLPVHLQPYYRQRYRDAPLRGAEAYYRRVLSLPLFVGMTDADAERVVDAVRELLFEYGVGVSHRTTAA